MIEGDDNIKKILILCCLSIAFNISAKEYYTEYGNYSEWQEKEVLEDNLTLVEEKTKYRYYHESIEGNYYIKDENPLEYNLIQEDNFIYSEYTDYTFDEIENKKGRIIDSKKVYEYQDALPIKYIVFKNPHGGYGSLRISELAVTTNDHTYINYQSKCTHCSDDFDFYIKNHIADENKSHIFNDGELIIELEDYYNVEDIILFFYLYDITPEDKEVEILFYNKLDDEPIMAYNLVDRFICTDLSDVKYYSYNYNNLNLNLKYSEPQYQDEYIEPSLTKKVNEKLMSRYKDTYYYYYKIVRDFSDYMDEPTTYYNNKSDEFIKNYRHKKRNKIIIDDNIIIKSPDDRIDNYIKADEYEIVGEINYQKNGTYDILIKAKDLEIPVTIRVDLPLKNEVENYNKLIEKMNDDNQKINKLNEKLVNDNLELKEKISTDHKESRKRENEIINARLNKKENTNFNNDFLLNIPKNHTLFIPILSIILIIVLFLYKKENKN